MSAIQTIPQEALTALVCFANSESVVDPESIAKFECGLIDILADAAKSTINGHCSNHTVFKIFENQYPHNFGELQPFLQETYHFKGLSDKTYKIRLHQGSKGVEKYVSLQVFE